MTETQTAMLLTDQEWDDLEVMVRFFLLNANPDLSNPIMGPVFAREKALAERIIEANSD